MDNTFFIWLVVAMIQIALFSFYLGKMNNFNKKELIEKTVDIVPVCNYNDNTYWMENGTLYREPIKSVTMSIDRAEKIDQLESKDLSPSELIYIINILEGSK